MYPRYRIIAIRPKHAALYGGLAGGVMGAFVVVFELCFVLFLGGFFGGKTFEADVLFLLIPAVIALVVLAFAGAITAGVGALLYNIFRPVMGTLSLRLSKSYVRN